MYDVLCILLLDQEGRVQQLKLLGWTTGQAARLKE